MEMQINIKKLCLTKGMNYKCCMPIIMPENYIALFKTLNKNEAIEIIAQAQQAISNTVQYIKNNQSVSIKNFV